VGRGAGQFQPADAEFGQKIEILDGLERLFEAEVDIGVDFRQRREELAGRRLGGLLLNRRGGGLRCRRRRGRRRGAFLRGRFLGRLRFGGGAVGGFCRRRFTRADQDLGQVVREVDRIFHFQELEAGGRRVHLFGEGYPFIQHAGGDGDVSAGRIEAAPLFQEGGCPVVLTAQGQQVDEFEAQVRGLLEAAFLLVEVLQLFAQSRVVRVFLDFFLQLELGLVLEPVAEQQLDLQAHVALPRSGGAPAQLRRVELEQGGALLLFLARSAIGGVRLVRVDLGERLAVEVAEFIAVRLQIQRLFENLQRVGVLLAPHERLDQLFQRAEVLEAVRQGLVDLGQFLQGDDVDRILADDRLERFEQLQVFLAVEHDVGDLADGGAG